MNWLKKELCLSFELRQGQTRTLRFGTLPVFLSFVFAALFSAGCAFVVSDYFKLQISRTKNFMRLKLVSEDRDRLISANETLRSEIARLQEDYDRAENFGNQVKGRLEDLAAALKSVDAMSKSFQVAGEDGLPEAEDEQVHSEAVGGGEIPCDKDSASPCAIPEEDGDFKAQASPVVFEENDRESIIEKLDYYSDVIKNFPIGNPVTAFISSAFGKRISPFGRGLSLHEGIDYEMPKGSAVFATGDGVIKEVKRNSTYGLMVDVMHGDRVVTRYAHLSKAFVKPGEKICRGEILGLVGSTGRSTGPHLHYEVRVDGEPKNPDKFIKLALALKSAVG